MSPWTWLALGLFLAGVLEYVLAAYLTYTIVVHAPAQAFAVTFLNILLWGFVVVNLKVADVPLLVIHAVGCAIGASATCWWTGRRAPSRQ